MLQLKDSGEGQERALIRCGRKIPEKQIAISEIASEVNLATEKVAGSEVNA